MRRVLIGIDPGVSGAISALYRPGGLAEIHDMPVVELQRGGKNRRELDLPSLADLLRRLAWQADESHAFVEQVWGQPGESSVAAFSFGKGYGAILGILAALKVPTTLTPSMVWKKRLAVNGGKDGARARASQLLPDEAGMWKLKKHDGRAESRLLIVHGERFVLSHQAGAPV